MMGMEGVSEGLARGLRGWELRERFGAVVYESETGVPAMSLTYASTPEDLKLILRPPKNWL